ncbi:MAG: hypothetical protein DME15_08695 [Candidatus Rokuibacteriota bacterium]|nr:MAG: hypothetical protein DME15_08695 [Candidatus Rokubacteria bacterium]
MRRARPLRSLLLGASLWASTLPAAAQELADVTRPCRRADLIGAWVVIRLGAAPGARVDRSDPTFYPHQEYVFYKNATVRHVASQARITDADHRALLSAAPDGTWAVDGEGSLLLQRAGQTSLERSACLVLLKEVVEPKTHLRSLRGDILLTDADGATQPRYRSQLRKLRGPGE